MQFVTIPLQANAIGALFAHQNLLHSCIGKNLAAGRLDHRNNRARDGTGSSHRVVAARKVVLGQHGMHEKARLPGRQAIVAPLSGQYRDQFLIRGQRFQDLAGGLEANAWHQQFAGSGI